MSTPPDTCAFCQRSGTDEITGELQKTLDGKIVAHYNCMLYSPKVTTEDNSKGFNFNIKSVRSELKRGEKLRCHSCKRKRATVGCYVTSCRKNYHFPCAIKAGGSKIKEGYKVFCAEHKDDNGSKDFERKTGNHVQKSTKKKMLGKSAGKSRKSNIEKQQINNANMENGKMNEQSDVNLLICKELEENEEAVPSTSHQWSSGTSDSIPTPTVLDVFSLSNFPKSEENYNPNRKPNEKLKEVLQTLSSRDLSQISQMYSELGGSQSSVEMPTPQDDQNAENYLCEPLENQENSDDHITKKRKLCQDSGEPSPNKRSPHTSGIPAQATSQEVDQESSAEGASDPGVNYAGEGSPVVPQQARKSFKRDENFALDGQLNTMLHERPSLTVDQDYFFSMLVYTALKDLPREKKFSCRNEIWNVLNKYATD